MRTEPCQERKTTPFGDSCGDLDFMDYQLTVFLLDLRATSRQV
ncbi:hypothetical protein M6B38_299555 [Iris pallida]|uniref:Uncharacterized protein n=1 Tax=Iris pallida TaxID=29817 RepID=A0AAX6HQC0_IRIPA|nr:hypothetical protein M6B38_299555 [Iris pallida]